MEASEWNELTQLLRELFQGKNSGRNTGFEAQCSLNENLRAELVNIHEMRNPYFLMVVDIALLDLSTDIWKEQLNFLDKYSGKAKFAWVLNHDTSNAIKMELRRKGHVLMVNKPLYKAKMVQIIEAVIKDKRSSSNALRSSFTAITKEGDLHECLEIDSTQFETASSDESDMSELGSSKSLSSFQMEENQRERMSKLSSSKYNTVKNCLVELTHVYPDENNSRKKANEVEDEKTKPHPTESEPKCPTSPEKNEDSSSSKDQGNLFSTKATNEQKSLQGLRILIAEDTPVLQRVATIMLEKMGATVTAVGDGLQAVDALNCSVNSDEGRRQSFSKDACTCSKEENSPFDLILMDCQVISPKTSSLFVSFLVYWFFQSIFSPIFCSKDQRDNP